MTDTHNSGKKPGKPTGSGERAMKVRVLSAKGRKLSSKLWLQRQLNDPYVAAAKRDGYRSRAAYKLIEIADKYALLKPGDVVVDLGAAPGGWSQIVAKRVRADAEAAPSANSGGGANRVGKLVAIDILDMDPIPGGVVMKLDFSEPDAPGRIIAALGGVKAQAVLSDMAPPAMGHRQTDHLRIMALCELALDLAREILAPGGVFLAKVWQGGAERALLDLMKQEFSVVRHVKPKASRPESAELYVLATGFRGSQAPARM
jgi:23S rRNA (uridine2552-2'-O)-methyltransferase